MLKPVALYPDPARTNGALVMCEVSHAGWRHAARVQQPARPSSTTRMHWYGFEQEYFFYRERPSARLPGTAATRLRRARTTPASATPTSASVAREIVEEHLDLCLAAGINHEGINAEVAKGQWEFFEIFGKGSKKAADQIWMARYLLQRL